MPVRETPWPVGMPNWVDIMVPDLQAGLSFYTSVLGWSYEDTGPDFNHFRLCQVDGKYAGGIGAVESPEQPVAWTVYLASDDLDATVKLINENGGSVIVGPMDIPETGRFAIAAYLTVPVYRAFHEWLGRGELMAPMQEAWAAGDRKAALEAIPDELVDDLVVHGEPAACRERIQEYVDNGITTPVLAVLPAGMDPATAARELSPSAGS